jgi:hypothetical protein
MLSRIEVVRTFATSAPPEAVWAALEAAPRWPEVLSDLIEARIDPGGVLAPGAVMRVRARPGSGSADMSYRVTAAEPPHRLAIKSEGEHFTAQSEYRIERSGPGSRVTMTARAQPLLWLHKITTALSRRYYTNFFGNAVESRTRAMLTLAERIARGD